MVYGTSEGSITRWDLFFWHKYYYSLFFRIFAYHYYLETQADHFGPSKEGVLQISAESSFATKMSWAQAPSGRFWDIDQVVPESLNKIVNINTSNEMDQYIRSDQLPSAGELVSGPTWWIRGWTQSFWKTASVAQDQFVTNRPHIMSTLSMTKIL